MGKVAVTISRHWNSPEIHSAISGDGIAIAIAWDAAVDALADELVSGGRWITESQCREKMRDAAKRFINKVKEESAKVV